MARRWGSFALALGVVLALLHGWYRLRVEPRDPFLRVVKAERALQPGPEIVVLGDSHAAICIRASRLGDRAFNLASPAESLLETNLKVRGLLERRSSLRLLVLSVDDYSFGAGRRGRRLDRAMVLAEPSVVRESYGPGFTEYWFARLARVYPLLDARNARQARTVAWHDLRSLLGRPPAERLRLDDRLELSFADGQVWSVLAPAERTRRAEREVRRKLAGRLVVSELESAFADLVDRARAQRVVVVAVRVPLTREYRAARAALDTSSPRAVVRDSGVVAVLDYEEIFDDYPGLFHDEDHLTPEGAVIFTERLRRDLDLFVDLRR